MRRNASGAVAYLHSHFIDIVVILIRGRLEVRRRHEAQRSPAREDERRSIRTAGDAEGERLSWNIGIGCSDRHDRRLVFRYSDRRSAGNSRRLIGVPDGQTHRLFDERVRSSVVCYTNRDVVRSRPLRFGRRPAEYAADRIDTRSRRHGPLQAEGELIGRQISIRRHGGKRQQGLFVPTHCHRNGQPGRQIDFIHSHRDRLTITQRRRTVVGGNHVERISARALRFRRCPAEYAAGRIYACPHRHGSPETILKGVRNNLSRHVRIRHAGLKRQERAFAAGLITDQIEYRWLIHFRDRDGDRLAGGHQAVAEGEGHVVARRPLRMVWRPDELPSRRVECRPLRQASRAVDQRLGRDIAVTPVYREA